MIFSTALGHTPHPSYSNCYFRMDGKWSGDTFATYKRFVSDLWTYLTPLQGTIAFTCIKLSSSARISKLMESTKKLCYRCVFNIMVFIPTQPNHSLQLFGFFQVKPSEFSPYTSAGKSPITKLWRTQNRHESILNPCHMYCYKELYT